jgi:hypothetical protein
MKKSRIHATRTENFQTSNQAVIIVWHDDHMDESSLLSAIDRCFTDWYKTPEGRKAWDDACHELNIGDVLCGAHPDNEFTQKYGFVFDLDSAETEFIEINYDRILGDGDDDYYDAEDF